LQEDLESNSPFAYRLKRQGGRLSKQSVAKKAKQREEALGMPYGTAFSRLRKLVLFDCLKRHGENVCYRCGRGITCCSEMSFEHKLPWERGSSELFWDINNVAFSHLKCNAAAGGAGTRATRMRCRRGHDLSVTGNTHLFKDGAVRCKKCKNLNNFLYKERRKTLAAG
jgi:hypothetical protein